MMPRFEKLFGVAGIALGVAAMMAATPALAHRIYAGGYRLHIGYRYGSHHRYGFSYGQRAIHRVFAHGYGGYLGGYASGPDDTSGPPYYASGAYPFLYYRYPARYLRALSSPYHYSAYSGGTLGLGLGF